MPKAVTDVALQVADSSPQSFSFPAVPELHGSQTPGTNLLKPAFVQVDCFRVRLRSSPSFCPIVPSSRTGTGVEQERWRTLNDATQEPLGAPTGWLAICSFILFCIS